jgi:hypothetical protein
MGMAATVSLLKISLSVNGAATCWYLCWYQQQLTMKLTSNSIAYGTKRLPARGTTLRPSGFAWRSPAKPKGEARPA